MKTLYLHIGTPKTATSSIQKFLAQNREVLENKGYVYPKSLQRYPNVSVRRNGHFLVGKIVDSEGKRDFELEKQYLQEGYQLIADLMKVYDNVILSDESIWYASSYTYKDVFECLQKHADENGYQVKVIVYLRRQDSFFLSRWNQSVKMNTGTTSVLTCDKYIKRSLKKDGKILNYAQKIDAIADIFGTDHVIVRRFEPATWVDHSIIHDFMQAINLPVTDEFAELERDVNLRFGKNETEIKRIINANTTLSDQEIVFFGRYLKEQSATKSKEKPSGMLSAEETENFLASYEAGNTYVAETYIGDGQPLFSEQVKNVPKWSADNEQMLTDVVTFFTSVTMDLYRKNQEQDREIARLQKENERLRNRFMQFLDKVKHPVRTIWNKIFKRRSRE